MVVGGLVLESWVTSSAREKGRAMVTTPALLGEEGKAILGGLPHKEAGILNENKM